MNATHGPSTEPQWRRVLGGPTTREGLVALALLGLHLLFMLLWRVEPLFGLRGGRTFFANPLHAVTILLAGAFAIAAGALALFAVIRRKDLSIVLFAIIVYGLFVGAFGLGEVLSPH